MASRTSSTGWPQARWRVVPLLLGAAILAASCSGGGSSATTDQAAPGTVPGTTVNLRSTAPSTSASITAAVRLWKELRDAGVSSTITGFDQNGRFSLATSDPARVRQVVTDLQTRSAGTTTSTGSCPSSATVSVEESTTPPDPQPGPAEDRKTPAFQTTAAIKAGTAGESAFGGSIRAISIRPDQRPPTVVVAANEAASKQAAADFGPGLVVVTEMFVDPATERLRSAPRSC